MADAMSERMEQVSRAATERLLATQRDLAAARADAASMKAALMHQVHRTHRYLPDGCDGCAEARAALEAQ